MIEMQCNQCIRTTGTALSPNSYHEKFHAKRRHMQMVFLQHSLELLSISIPMFSQVFPLWCVPATLVAFIVSEPRGCS